MKQYLIGGIIGYLVTSIFGISPPPSSFWWILALASALGSYLYFVWWRLDDDNLGDFDE